MKIIKLLLLIVVLTSKFTILNAEVKPTFNKKFDLTGGVVDHPADVKFSPDGRKVFLLEFSSGNDTSDVELIQFTLTTPFDISSIDTSTKVSIIVDAGVDALAGPEGFAFSNDGKKVFIIDFGDKMQVNTLETAYDLTNATRVADDGINWGNYLSPTTNTSGTIDHREIEFNNDGTRMYFLDAHPDHAVVSYILSTPYDPSTASLGPELALGDISSTYLQDIEFDDDGTRMYINESATSLRTNRTYVYKLSTTFDVSTATYVGSSIDIFTADGDGQSEASQGRPLGMTFSSDGMKLYRVTYSHSGNASDIIYEYDLSCPYGIVLCEIDATSSVGAQVDFAKNVIHHNTSTVFKRFEWIRRNKNNSNLDNHNVKLNIKNPILASLTNKLQASLGSHSSNKSKNWSYWSHGDISFGRAGDTDVFKPKEIRSSGLLFGADRRVDENKFFGAAIRVGKENVDIISSGGTSLDLESLTLNIYGTNGTGFDALVGVSLLRVDQLLSKELTGERNGKQFFTSIRFKTRNSYGNLNVTPLAKIDYGVTEYSEYTDFGTSTNQNLDIYESHTFSTGGVEAGYIFDSIIEVDEGTLKPLGSLTYVGDWTPTTSYKYKNYSDFTTVTNEIERHSTNNIKGNIGIEAIFKNGTTFSVNYERLQKLNDSAHNDNIYFKFGHISAEDSEFAFNFNPMQNNQTNVNYKKTINGYDVVVSSNYSSNNKIPEYGANIEILNTF
mgnify:CR=1 FL=1